MARLAVSLFSSWSSRDSRADGFSRRRVHVQVLRHLPRVLNTRRASSSARVHCAVPLKCRTADLPRRRILRRPVYPLHRAGHPRNDAPLRSSQRSPHRQRLDRPSQSVPCLPRLCAGRWRRQEGVGDRDLDSEERGRVLGEIAVGGTRQRQDPQWCVRGDSGSYHGQHGAEVRFTLHAGVGTDETGDSVNGLNMCVNNYDVRLTDTHPACGMNWPPDLSDITPYLQVRLSQLAREPATDSRLLSSEPTSSRRSTRIARTEAGPSATGTSERTFGSSTRSRPSSCCRSCCSRSRSCSLPETRISFV